MQSRDSFYIGGRWVEPSTDETIDVESPSTQRSVAKVPAGKSEDIHRAVQAAVAAFDEWSLTSPDDRAAAIERVAEGLDKRKDEVAQTIATEVGTPLRIATSIQAGLPLSVASSLPTITREYAFEERIGNSLVLREPVGVVGAITPWNYPLHQVVAKVAPALAAGCTIVLKPSEVAPLCAYLLADIIDEAKLPAGVLNLVTGYGSTVGEAIARHPGVDMVSFTGSVRSGRRISELAARDVKKVALELGGKSANVVLPDADLATAVKVGVANCFLNSGQTCNAWTRMLVHRDQHDEIVDRAVEVAKRYAPGDPLQQKTRLGPVVSAGQRDRVRGYIDRGTVEGARLATGGTEPPKGLSRGYYVRPTVFGRVRSQMTIAQEEIFGPVLSILPYADEDDAVRIANDSAYGLAGAVWSADQDHGIDVARRIRTGQLDINGGQFNPEAPFGGFKHSGHGRELGRYGLAEFLTTKSLQL
ncbi:MAG: aldehyde dehydrogenase family protein [Streptosporangiaceae bacterium]